MPDPLPISVLLLARDEARRLETLLPALSFAREVVVVWDARGDRGVREAAERHGARVFERALDGFGPQRQFALERCTQPWVLWLDADERPSREMVANLRGWFDRSNGGGDADPAGLRFLRRTWFLGRRIRFCGWRGERLVRGFRRERARFDDAPVHERVLVEGRLADLPGAIEHDSYATWAECREKLVRYAAAGAEKAWRQGRRAGPLDVAFRPPLRFLRMYVLQLGFLDGAHGLVLCALAAAQVLLKYAELWERTRAGAGR
jgi:glycosyl transferase family 2